MSKKYFNRKLDKIADEANRLNAVRERLPFETEENIHVRLEIAKLMDHKHRLYLKTIDKLAS